MTGPELKEKFGKGMFAAAIAALIGASASNIFGVLGWGAQHFREADLADTAASVRLQRVEGQIVNLSAEVVRQTAQSAAEDARLVEITTNIRDMRADLVRRTEVLVALRSLTEETRNVVQTLSRGTCTQAQCDHLEGAISGNRRNR